MHFTIHMRGERALDVDYSYGLVFIPCPVWVKGSKQILNLNPETPEYKMGSIKKLIKKERLDSNFSNVKDVHIIVHPIGYGTVADFSMLLKDFIFEGFKVQVSGELGSNGSFALTGRE